MPVDAPVSEAALPDGWEVVEESCYYKLAFRDAVHVPKRYAGDEPFSRDVVVLVTDDTVGIVQGPNARTTWEVGDPDAAAVRVAKAMHAWLEAGGGPYADAALTERLEAAVDGDEPEVAADGGWVSEPDGAEWCPECQRRRAGYAHLQDD